MKTKKIQLNSSIQYLLMIVVALIMVFPFFWILSSSLKDALEIRQFPPSFLPKTFQWENYLRVLSDSVFWGYSRNTLILILGNTVGTLISSSLVAYPLARMEFKGKNFIFSLIIATMMVPTITLIIPQYLMFSKIGWLDTLLPMIVPACFAYPYNVFLFRQFFRGIPKSMDEAAAIDGCNKFQVYSKILIPLSKSVFVTIAVLSAVFWWNELLQPLIYVNSDTWKTLTIGTMTRYRYFNGNLNIVSWNILMAVSTILIIPPMLLYLLASKSLVEGIKTSGMKD
jgi:multiple sugar transport system permease protein